MTFDYVYVSDLQRTRDTFECISKENPSVSEVDREYISLIREKDGGVLNGKPLKTWKERADLLKMNIRSYKCENG